MRPTSFFDQQHTFNSKGRSYVADATVERLSVGRPDCLFGGKHLSVTATTRLESSRTKKFWCLRQSGKCESIERTGRLPIKQHFLLFALSTVNGTEPFNHTESPPNASILSCTHSKPSSWSCIAWLPCIDAFCKARKPSGPRR